MHFHTGDEEETKDKCVNMRLQCVAERCNWESQDLNEGLAEKTLVMHLQLAHQVAPVQQQGGGQDRVGAAAAGSLQPCQLGRDKTRRYQIFRDWITQAEAKMGFLGITESKQKIGYLRSNAGAELTNFFEKEVRARFSDITADEGRGIQAQQAHTYDELIAESNKVLLAVVSRDRAVIDLLRMSQGDKHAMECG